MQRAFVGCIVVLMLSLVSGFANAELIFKRNAKAVDHEYKLTKTVYVKVLEIEDNAFYGDFDKYLQYLQTEQRLAALKVRVRLSRRAPDLKTRIELTPEELNRLSKKTVTVPIETDIILHLATTIGTGESVYQDAEPQIMRLRTVDGRLIKDINLREHNRLYNFVLRLVNTKLRRKKMDDLREAGRISARELQLD